ncbi:MAG: acylphosphatase [Cyclobacteriaceae bacterium]
MKHWSIDIQGNVQGVFFRATTRETAQKMGIKGFVENCPDGSVHIEAEASEEKLGKFLEWCHKGPPNANVTAVDYREEALKNYNGFEIKR